MAADWEATGKIPIVTAEALFDKAYAATGRRDEIRAWAVDIHTEKVGRTENGPTFRVFRNGSVDKTSIMPLIEASPSMEDGVQAEGCDVAETEGVDVAVAKWLLTTLANELVKDGNSATNRLVHNDAGHPAARLVAQITVDRSYGVAHILSKLAAEL